MGYRVSKRYNRDGSITKTTTVSRKTIFGNTKSETYSERIPPKGSKSKGKLPWWIWAIIILVIIGVISGGAGKKDSDDNSAKTDNTKVVTTVTEKPAE